MKTLNVFLGDLSYINAQNRYNLFVPLNIGYIASYIKKQFGNDVKITLFKDPNQLLEELAVQKPDVLGLSFSYWNTALNHSVVKHARSLLGEDLMVIWGGPSVDTDSAQQLGLFRRFPEVDSFITNEGELGFANVIRKRLSENVGDIWNEPIDGAVHLKDGNLLKGINVGLSLDLETLDSPYLTGLMDPFLEGNYLAMLQTSRLCPYTCAFCVSGKNRGKLRAFPYDQVIEEIDFITRHYKDKPHLPMHIVDENFGILERDAELADYILESSNSEGYPKGMAFYNDKRFSKTAKHVIEKLGNMTLYGMVLSLQTENPETLKEISRRNLTPEQIEDAISWASERNLNTTTELIFGLPYETKESFVKFLNNALSRGFDSILINNLFIVDGIEMAREGYRDKHGLKTRFRPTNANQGLIGDTYCMEYEEVVVGSNSFSFEDYKVMRLLNFMFYAIFSLGFYKWFFQFVRHSNIPLADFLSELVSLPEFNSNTSTTAWHSLIQSFTDASADELFDSPQELHDFAHQEFKNNNNQVSTPALLNILYGAQLICLEKESISDALINTLEKFVERDKNLDLFATAEFLIGICQKERINIFDRETPEDITTNFDLIGWKRDKFKKPINQYEINNSSMKFMEDPEFTVKFPEFEKSFSGMEKSNFYFNALQFMVPRTQLLYDISLDET